MIKMQLNSLKHISFENTGCNVPEISTTVCKQHFLEDLEAPKHTDMQPGDAADVKVRGHKLNICRYKYAVFSHETLRYYTQHILSIVYL